MFKNELSHGLSSGHLALFTAFAFTLTSTEFQACRMLFKIYIFYYS